MAALPKDLVDTSDATLAELQALSRPAYVLALRLVGAHQDAEDVVQQAYLNTLRRLRGGPPPQEARTWFLTVVANTAKNHLKGEARRIRREQCRVDRQPDEDAADSDLVQALRIALDGLDPDHRAPLSLCYEQGLSQREAAMVLNLPASTLADRVREGLSRLHKALARAGYAAAPAAVIGGLSHTAPPVPAALVAAIEKIVSGGLAAKSTGAAAASAAAKGGLYVKIVVGVVAAGVLAGAAAVVNGVGAGFKPAPTALSSPPPAAPAEGKPAPVNDYKGMQEREEVFEFAEKPKVTKDGDKWTITFASKGKCDATVSIVDKDGKIVRHLASGVLGKNAPWPFKQDSLSQSVEWDGQDDFGKPAPAGCKIRVGLGVKFTYERAMGWSVDSMAAQSFVVGKDGTVYCVGSGSIRAFDRDGKYVRTLMPPQGGLKPEDYGAFQLMKTKYGDQVLFSDWFGPFQSISGIIGGAALTPDGSRLLFYSAGDPYRDAMQLMVVDSRTGALPNVRKVGHVTEASGGRLKAGIGIWGVDPVIQTTEQWPRTRLHVGLSVAVAPDGDTVYFSGAQNAVYRKKLSELTLLCRLNVPVYGLKPDQFAGKLPEVFAGERDKAGSDEKHFNRTTGVACDSSGNVYVGDWWNNRIQVFKPDGALIKSLPATRPGQIAVSPKTGEVFYADTTSQMAAAVKLGGLADPAVKAKFAAPYKFKDADREPAISPALGLDCEASPPIVWLGVGEKVYRLLDKGASFEKSAEIVGTGGGLVFSSHQRLAVDLDSEALYYSSSPRTFSPPWYRFDGKTGRRDEGFKGGGWEDMAIAPDGAIHCRTGGYGRFVVRYDRDWKPLPFKRGVPPAVKVGQPYAGEPPAGWPADGKAIYTGVGGHSNVWQPGMAVGVNGDVYVRTQGVTQPWHARRFPANKPLSADEVEAKWAEDMPAWGKTPGAQGGGNFNLVSVWDRDGNEKAPSAVDNLARGGTVAVDAFGSIYVGCGNVAKGGWAEMDKGSQPQTSRSWGSQGSVFKFAGLGGKFPLGNTAGNNFKDAAWTYTGHAPCCPSDCGCALSVFSADLHGRLYVPAMQLYSVMILDSNGNKVMRLGRYGNADCQGKGSLVPEPDIGLHWVQAVAASDRALYIADNGNRRIVKAALSYAAEEAAPLP